MISDDEKKTFSSSNKSIWIIKKKILAKHEANFYCLNCVYSFKTTNKLGLYEKVCVNHKFYQIVLPSKKSGYSNVKESW